MIFKTAITQHTGTVFHNLGNHVLNTDMLGRVRSIDGASQFFYTDATLDRQRKPMPVYCDSTLAAIQSAINTVLLSNVMDLDIFINNDITESTLSKFINYSQFIYAFGHALNTDYSWVTYVENFHITKSLVNASLDDLITVATSGSQLLNPASGFILLNPATGLPLLNPS